MVFVTGETRKGTTRHSQRYVDPLLVLTGEEYAKMPFQTLLDKLAEAVRSGPRITMAAPEFAEWLAENYETAVDSDFVDHVFTNRPLTDAQLRALMSVCRDIRPAACR